MSLEAAVNGVQEQQWKYNQLSMSKEAKPISVQEQQQVNEFLVSQEQQQQRQVTILVRKF